jgi:hypothetical protein
MILKKKIIFDKKTAISKTRIMSLDRFFLMWWNSQFIWLVVILVFAFIRKNRNKITQLPFLELPIMY